MSLNLFAALVGSSGAGKDAAEGVAGDAFTWGQPSNPLYHYTDPIPVVPLGTGEGVARTFRPLGTKPDDENPIKKAIFTAPEIDTWTALSSRQGATITAELRKPFTGGTIGFANAGKDTRNVVKAHSYRACGTFGVQPLRSGPLLAAADGGLPQRFAWLPAADPDAPNKAPAQPDPLPDPMPDWDTAEDVTHSGDQIVVAVPGIARQQIDAHRLAVLRGDPDVDPLDGHALLTRLKVAAALMALDGRTAVIAEDWELAGVVMAVSTATREDCRQALADQARRTNQAKAHDQAERETIIADRMANQAQRRVVKAICGKLRRVGRATRRDLRVACAATIRSEFDGVFEMLFDKQIVAECEPDGKRFTLEYEFGPEYEPGVS